MRSKSLVAGLSALVLLCVGAPLWAANVWDGAGGTNGNWSSAANWDNDAVPTFPAALTFAGSTQLENTNDLTGITVNGFTFDAAAGAFTINGNAITLGGNIGFSANPAASVTHTIGLGLALSGERTVATQPNGNIALTNVLTGSGGLLVTGGGTNSLSGNSTFSGGVTLNSGTLRVMATNTAMGAGTLRVNGGTLHLANDFNLNFGRNTFVSNDATLVTDNFTPAGANRTHTLGTLSIGSQTLTVSKGTNITGTSWGQITFGATTLTGDPVFDVMPYSYIQLNTSVSESGGARKLTFNGTGTNPLMILNGTGSWTGGTEVNGTGFVRASAANSLGALGTTTTFNGTDGTLELRNNTAATGRYVNFKGNTRLNLRNNGNLTCDLAGITVDPGLAVSFSVDRASTGSGYIQILNAPLNFLGAGTLNVSMGNSCVPVVSNVVSIGGTLTLNAANSFILSGIIDDGTESCGIIKTGAGALTLTRANKYDGGTTISAGRLVLGSQAAATNAGPVLVNGGVYDLNGLTAVTNGAVTITAGAISNGTLNASSIALLGGLVYANLAGVGSLSCGGGLPQLLGNNTYSGGTAVNGGVLIVPTTAQLPGWDVPGAVSVASGAGLAVGNAVSDADAATIMASGAFASGAGFGFDTALGDRAYTPVFSNLSAGALGLVKLGPNTLTLSSGNTYSGGTAVLGGTLYVPDGTALGAGGGLMLSNNAVFRFGGDTVLENQPILVRGGARIAGDEGYKLTAPNDLTVASGSLVLTGACMVALGGSNTFASSTYVYGGTLQFMAESTNLFPGAELRVANNPGVTGRVEQVGGYVSISGGNNGLLMGNNGSEGTYVLDGGLLRALPTTSNRGVMLGVNHFSTGTFHLVSGVVTGSQLQVSRSDSGGTNSAGFYYQRSGISSYNSLHLAGGSAANSANNVALLAVSNGTFVATTFSGLAGGANSSARIYLGSGVAATLGAFPTARGSGSYSEITFDGATLTPAAASTTYMSALTKAYLTDLGGTFDVPAGRNITVSQQ